MTTNVPSCLDSRTIPVEMKSKAAAREAPQILESQLNALSRPEPFSGGGGTSIRGLVDSTRRTLRFYPPKVLRDGVTRTQPWASQV